MKSVNRNKRHIRHLTIDTSAYEKLPLSGGRGKMVSTILANSALITLDLRDGSIEDNGAQALSEILKTNSTLTSLDLETNSIGDHGAQALAVALKTNSTLTALNLEDNSIGENGAQALSEALKTNSTCVIKDLDHILRLAPLSSTVV